MGGDRAYRGLYRGPDGRQHSTAVWPSIKLAQRARDEARGDVAAGGWLNPARTGVILDAFMHEWMPARQKVRPYVLEKDWSRYQRHIQPHLGHVPLRDITVVRVQQWMTRLAALGTQPPTIGKAHELLRTALGPLGALGDQRIRVNPCALAKPPAVAEPEWTLVTREQFAAFRQEVPEPYRCLVTVAVWAGLRWSEIAALRRRHYDRKGGALIVEAGCVYHRGRIIEGPPKSRKPRRVPLLPEVTETLDAHLLLLPVDDLPLFRSPRGAVLRHPHFTGRVYHPAAVRAGLGHYEPFTDERGRTRQRYSGVRIHDLRHSCASWLLAAGMSIQEVRDILGHATITTTQRYTHTDDSQLRAKLLRAFQT